VTIFRVLSEDLNEPSCCSFKGGVAMYSLVTLIKVLLEDVIQPRNKVFQSGSAYIQ
jgi:hypothetical protein